MEEEDEQSLFTHSDTASCIFLGMGGKARRFGAGVQRRSEKLGASPSNSSWVGCLILISKERRSLCTLCCTRAASAPLAWEACEFENVYIRYYWTDQSSYHYQDIWILETITIEHTS